MSGTFLPFSSASPPIPCSLLQTAKKLISRPTVVARRSTDKQRHSATLAAIVTAVSKKSRVKALQSGHGSNCTDSLIREAFQVVYSLKWIRRRSTCLLFFLLPAAVIKWKKCWKVAACVALANPEGLAGKGADSIGRKSDQTAPCNLLSVSWPDGMNLLLPAFNQNARGTPTRPLPTRPPNRAAVYRWISSELDGREPIPVNNSGFVCHLLVAFAASSAVKMKSGQKSIDPSNWNRRDSGGRKRGIGRRSRSWLCSSPLGVFQTALA